MYTYITISNKSSYRDQWRWYPSDQVRYLHDISMHKPLDPTGSKGEVMMNSNRAVKGLGEAAIRVEDLGAMRRFYEEVVGLELLRQEKEYVFFRIAEGYGGHAQVLALFDAADTRFLEAKSPTLSAEHSTLHHIAFNVALEDFEAEKGRLEGLGVEVHAAEHAWLHVRSLYFADPEGNIVELVAYDESLRQTGGEV